MLRFIYYVNVIIYTFVFIIQIYRIMNYNVIINIYID